MAWLLACLLPSGVFAQETNGRLKVYLDCNNCFGDYIRAAASPPRRCCSACAGCAAAMSTTYKSG